MVNRALILPGCADASTDFTTRDGCRISYRVYGNGPEAIVILPGWSQTAAQFDRAIPLFGDEFTVVADDHRNHGSPDEYPFSSTYQGRAGAHVQGVPIHEQRVQGGVIS